ncbi:hypothetical protein Sjap_022126 [Stephania japonica]|uniref:DEAD/DEAH-box helicase domain-containing protein n=1 Tax=Stephania japonica TaxID=461633 RepID=A0AAP0HSH7_9MAGN
MVNFEAWDDELGKTLAFGIPSFVHVLCKKKLGDLGRACPWCSVLSPNRELAQQIADVLCKAGKSCGVKSICLFGGSSKGPHIQGLKSMLFEQSPLQFPDFLGDHMRLEYGYYSFIVHSLFTL